MELARQIAAQCWCDEETSKIEMDSVLAEAIAKRINSWMTIAAQNERNADFYRGLLDECANNLGVLKEEAYKSDDGFTHDSPIRLKIPELVRQLAETVVDLKDEVDFLRTSKEMK
jgi:hypothetical protein